MTLLDHRTRVRTSQVCPDCGHVVRHHRWLPGHPFIGHHPVCHVCVDDYHLAWGEECGCTSPAHR